MKTARELSPVMRAAGEAAKRVATWSRAKQEYAGRVVNRGNLPRLGAEAMTHDEIKQYKSETEIERLREENSCLVSERIENEAEIERLKRDQAALELECASWKQSSALKLVEIERLKEQVDTCRELRKYDRIEIERLRLLLEK